MKELSVWKNPIELHFVFTNYCRIEDCADATYAEFYTSNSLIGLMTNYFKSNILRCCVNNRI